MPKPKIIIISEFDEADGKFTLINPQVLAKGMEKDIVEALKKLTNQPK